MKSLLKPALSVLLSCGTTVIAQAQTGLMDRFVLEGKEAVLALPSELIAAPTVERVYLSPDGYHLLVLREKIKITPEMLANLAEGEQKTPDGEQELIYWNARTRIARSIWKGASFENNIVEVEWLPQTDTVFIIVQTLPSKALLSNPNPNAPIPLPEWKLLKTTEGQVRATEIPVPNLGIGGMLSLSASKTQPLMMLQITKENNVPPPPDGRIVQNTAIYLIRKDGRIDTPLTIPNADKTLALLPMWERDGKPVIHSVGEDGKPLHYAVDPKTLALSLLEGKFDQQEYKEPDRTRAGFLSLKPQKVMATIGETQKPISTLWLESRVESEAPRILLSGDGTEGNLLPKGDGAFYQSQGALWYTPFLRVNQAQFLAARKAGLKARALSDARQAGLGIYMYSQDYDDTLPDPDGIKDKIMPYVKNESVLENLVYTYGGGKITDPTQRGSTILGYVTGPGGRANIYADGRAKWEDDPKP